MWHPHPWGANNLLFLCRILIAFLENKYSFTEEWLQIRWEMNSNSLGNDCKFPEIWIFIHWTMASHFMRNECSLSLLGSISRFSEKLELIFREMNCQEMAFYFVLLFCLLVGIWICLLASHILRFPHLLRSNINSWNMCIQIPFVVNGLIVLFSLFITL